MKNINNRMVMNSKNKIKENKFLTEKQINRILDSSPNIECQLNEVTQI